MWIQEYETKKGIRYRFFERYTMPITGKVRTISVTYPNKTNATKKVAQQELIRLINDIIKPQKNINFFVLIDTYLKSREDFVKNSTLEGLKTIKSNLKKYFAEDITVLEITPKSLQSYIDSEIKRTSVERGRRILNFIKSAFIYGERLDYIDKLDIISRIEIKSKPKTIDKVEKERNKYLSQNELIDVLAALKISSPTTSLLCEFLSLTGLRYGEMVALRIQDYNLETNTIYINGSISFNKGGGFTRGTPKNVYSIRYVELDARAKVIIELFIDKAKQNRLWSPKGPKNTPIEDLYIFSTEAGNPIDISSTNKKLRDINYKKRLSTHVFRHTHISLLAEAGVPFTAIMQRVGHNDPNTTLAVYTHVTEKMQSATANAVNSIGKLLSKKVAT